jgi:hypothetical protein
MPRASVSPVREPPRIGPTRPTTPSRPASEDPFPNERVTPR